MPAAKASALFFNTGDTLSVIQAGSHFLSDAIIELELLAVVSVITKCDVFLAGPPHFAVVMDHHLLMPIFNHHRLDETQNSRLQRLKTKIMGYTFTAS